MDKTESFLNICVIVLAIVTSLYSMYLFLSDTDKIGAIYFMVLAVYLRSNIQK